VPLRRSSVAVGFSGKVKYVTGFPVNIMSNIKYYNCPYRPIVNNQ